MKKKFFSKEDREILRKARAILRKVEKKNAKLDEIRAICDENNDRGGTKWKATTLELYNFLDETWNSGIRVEQNGEVVLETVPRKGA